MTDYTTASRYFKDASDALARVEIVTTIVDDPMSRHTFTRDDGTHVFVASVSSSAAMSYERGTDPFATEANAGWTEIDAAAFEDIEAAQRAADEAEFAAAMAESNRFNAALSILIAGVDLPASSGIGVNIGT